jgi:O-antigen/teichoic acid export membrane protein
VSDVLGDRGPTGSLRERFTAGASWTLVGYGLAQVLRLGSNLVMTRLLAPEAFGLMLLTYVVIQGVQMFSDAGIRGSVVSEPRGEESRFLNTAFTFKMIRGVLIWFGVSALALPAAEFYDRPELLFLIPVAAGKALLDGAASTALFVLIRQVRPARRVILDLVAQIIGFLVMLAIALWLSRSVWALVFGGLVAAGTRSLGSHFLLSGPRNRFGWDADAARSLFRFGRWILLSTAMGFVLLHADKAVLGKILNDADLGRYAVATLIVQTVTVAMQRFSGTMLFPIYTELARKGPEELRSRLVRLRAGVLAAFVPPLWLVLVLGPEIIGLLYDDRYADAGWMAQILAVGAIAQLVTVSGERVILAHRDSFRFMLLQVARSVALVGGMIIGGTLAGSVGMIIGAATAHWVSYPAFCVALRPYGAWMPLLDGAVLVSTLGLAAFAWIS